MGVSDRTQMTWEPVKARWKKIFRGKSYTISCTTLGVPPSKTASYQAANAWWEDKKAEIDAATPLHPMTSVVAELERRRDWSDGQGDHETSKFLDGLASEARQESGARLGDRHLLSRDAGSPSHVA